MENKTQMINVKLGILYLYRKSFNFLFLFFLFPYLHSQNISTSDSDIVTQEKVIVSANDSIKTKNNKGLLYISGGAIIYSVNNISNAEFKKPSESQNKAIYSKQSTQIAKKASKKNIEEKKHKVKNVAYTKFNFHQKNNTSFNFLVSSKNEVITSSNVFPNFFINNNEYKVRLNNHRARKTKILHKSSITYNSYLFYIFTRPPPMFM